MFEEYPAKVFKSRNIFIVAEYCKENKSLVKISFFKDGAKFHEIDEETLSGISVDKLGKLVGQELKIVENGNSREVKVQ